MRGVYFNKQYQKWHARICRNGRNFHLGYFVREQDANEARREAERRFAREQQQLNQQQRRIRRLAYQ